MAEAIQEPRVESTEVTRGSYPFETGGGTGTLPRTPSPAAQKRIELRVRESFYEALSLLARDEGMNKADIIRKAIALYARVRIEQKHRKLIAFVNVDEDNKMTIEEVINV